MSYAAAVTESGGARAAVRGKLVDAASRLLREHSPDQLTTKAIAKSAGVNHGQIHHYFGSKAALYTAVVRSGSLRPELHGSSSLEGWDASVLPAPIDPDIHPGWQVFAYLMINDQWKQSEGTPSTNVLDLLHQRAAETGEQTPTMESAATTAATVSLQAGWWVFAETIIQSLRHFSADVSALPEAVANRSTRLIDETRSTVPVLSPAAVSISSGTEDDEEPTEVSDRLVWAAYHLLADSSPSAVTSKAIAERAGVNHGQIHHYFGSKDSLIAAAVNYDSDRFVASRRSVQVESIVPIQTLRRPSLWRTFAYLAMTGEGSAEHFQPTPNLTAMVESTAGRLGRPTNDPEVHAEVGAVYAMQHGWTTFQDILESTMTPFISDRQKFRMRLAELSTRLVDQPE